MLLFEERRVRHLPRWGVGALVTLGKHGGGLALLPPSPVVNGGHPSQVTGEGGGGLYCCWSLLYSAILRSRADSLHSHVILHEWLVFYTGFFVVCFLNIHRSGVLIALAAWLVPRETAAWLKCCFTSTETVGLLGMRAHLVHTSWALELQPFRRVLCTPYSYAPCLFMQSHIRKVRACLAVTCHLHFWQNDRDLLRASAVTRGWNGYWNNSRQHRKLTTGNKILPPLLDGLEPATFQSRVRRSNHWVIPAPQWRGRVGGRVGGYLRFLRALELIAEWGAETWISTSSAAMG